MAPAPFPLTQGVEDPSHEVEAHKHGHPASRPQAPRLHGIALLFSTKHLLYNKVARCQDPESPTNSVGPGGGALFLTEHREMGKSHV